MEARGPITFRFPCDETLFNEWRAIRAEFGEHSPAAFACDHIASIAQNDMEMTDAEVGEFYEYAARDHIALLAHLDALRQRIIDLGHKTNVHVQRCRIPRGG